jgi:ribose transport system permease protein
VNALSRDQWRVVFATIAAILLFVVGDVVRPGFASLGAAEAILVVASFVGFVATGQMFVILLGGIDLSVPWVLNAAAIVMAISTGGADGMLLLGLLATLGMGLLVGLINAIGIAVFGVPAVVMTLAMNGIMEGLTLGLSNGMTRSACAAYAPPIIQDAVHGHLLGVPAALYVWLVVLLLLVSFALKFTVFGRATYAVGNSARVSYLAGVRVEIVTISLYALSGFFSALAGIMLVGFGGQASLGLGEPHLFQSIAGW